MAQVLLAEDHALVRDGLRRILESAGHVVAGEVSNGLEVVEAALRLRPDVILLDLGLPGLHGLDVLPEVVRRASRSRVLILSGEDRDDFVATAIRQGAAGYLLKTGSTRELLDGVAAVARGDHFVSAALTEAVTRASKSTNPDRADPYDGLTTREREVLHLVAEGLTNRQIGERLSISWRTVETHRAHVMRKLGLHTQTDVVLFAVRRGMLPVHG